MQMIFKIMELDDIILGVVLIEENRELRKV